MVMSSKQGGYGITGLRGTLKDKTKGLVSGHYGIPGKLSGLEIQERIKFLTTQSNFCCGGINFEVRTRHTSVSFTLHELSTTRSRLLIARPCTHIPPFKLLSLPNGS